METSSILGKLVRLFGPLTLGLVLTVGTAWAFSAGSSASAPQAPAELGVGAIVAWDTDADGALARASGLEGISREPISAHPARAPRPDRQLAAPDLEIRKEDTGGYARPGGVYVYRVFYRNQGDGAAANTRIADKLPSYTSYADDTSGLPLVQAGDVITWSLGEVAPGGQGVFMVTLGVDPGAPTGSAIIGENCAVITTTTPGDSDLGNNEQCAGPVDVVDDEVEVRAAKGANPGDPTPGEEFEYNIEWCNNRGAAVGPLWLTDTLPISTTFVRWYPENWERPFWTEVLTTGGQVVLYAPGYPGSSCDIVRIRLFLDPEARIGSTLQNHVLIHAAGDVDLGNDEYTNTDAHVNPPRYDMVLWKGLNGGVLVPGGKIEYDIGYHNQGNAAVHAWLTDTLPAGTTFDRAWPSDGSPDQPIEPAIATDEYVVWDMGEIGVNQGAGLNVLLDLGAGISPGEVLQNCAVVGSAEVEDTPWDNEACIGTMVYSAGLPNLYVIKQIPDYGPGYEVVKYRIDFGNYGTEIVYDVHITDTFPVSMTFDGHAIDWGGSQFTETVTAEMLHVVFERMEPGWGGVIYVALRLDEPKTRMRWYTNTAEIDIPADDANPADNRSVATLFSGGEVDAVNVDVGGTAIWGEVPEGPVTITTPYGQVILETDGGFGWDAPDLIQPGDPIEVAAGRGAMPVHIDVPDPFDVHASSLTDTVWGQVDHLDHEWLEVGLERGPGKRLQTDGDGGFSATFADIPRGAGGEVRYGTNISYAEATVHRHFRTDDLVMTVDYGHDWVHSEYEPGHTVWITVTEGDGQTVKGQQALETAPMPEWGGRSGFETHGEDWVPGPVDIVSGDWVYGQLDNGYTSTVRVGVVKGEVNVASDTVSGTISAPWLAPDMVIVRCEIHEKGAPGIEISGVDPDDGTFFCDFGATWDIVPGHNVAVHYIEPGGDQVQTHPANPAPRLYIDKWSVNDSAPSAGGNLVFEIEYQNDGELSAEDVVITDTMAGMSYLDDTGGLPHSGTGSPGDPIVWDLGTLDAKLGAQFQVFVAVTGSVSDTITNTVEIATGNPFDQGGPDEKRRQWVGHVEEGNTQLSVGKKAWTDDPAPGADFVFQLDICNKGSTASSEFVLTDTLHPALALQYWWAGEPGWEEVASSPNQLVASRPSIPRGCSQLYVRVRLTDTASAGMYLTNTAVFSASNDLGGQDPAFWDGKAGEPHTNLAVYKTWEGGRLVPGGELRYGIQCVNNGNLPVGDVTLTDTLPAGASFVGLWQLNRDGQEIGPVTPSVISDDAVVWDAGAIENGDVRLFRILLAVARDAAPGSLLTNTVAVTRFPGEDSHDDNTAAWVERLHGYGPNLRVQKHGSWDDWGEGTRRASYFVHVENVGSVAVGHVTVTDTYPVSMDRDGGIETDWGRVESWGEDAAGHSFTITYDALWPGEGTYVKFGAIVPGSGPLPSGIAFTNTAEAVLVPDDVNPDDNRDQVSLTTGPEVFVSKEPAGGDPQPGGVITFSLAFGNGRPGNEWWWDMQGAAWLTDTLPPEMTFITSTLRWCDASEWCPFAPSRVDGDAYTWELWPLRAGEWNEVRVSAQLSFTLSGGEVITNVAEIRSDDPGDIEWSLGNNVSVLPIQIWHPGGPYGIHLPLVMREY